MNHLLSIPEAYQNLHKVTELLIKQKADTRLIESVHIARNVLLAIEMMGIVSSSLNEEISSKSVIDNSNAQP